MQEHPRIMGILNTTPDSFSDGGEFATVDAAVARGMEMAKNGAQILDIGGESTRPGAAAVSAEEEIARTIPVIRALVESDLGIPISIDTSKAVVAEEALRAGASIVNDVSAMSDPRMAAVVRDAGCEVVLMHMRGTPRTMQSNTDYADLVGEVVAMLEQRAEEAIAYGIAKERIVLDPGIGFGKRSEDNPRLFATIPRLKDLGFRTLVGASRKRFIGDITGVSTASERVYGSVGAALAAASGGADWIRVHDVLATAQALAVFSTCVTHVSEGH